MIDKKAKSALSLRLFGEDVTVAAKDASQKREQAISATVPTAGASAEEKDASTEVEVDDSLPST